jgi:recombination protein RecT
MEKITNMSTAITPAAKSAIVIKVKAQVKKYLETGSLRLPSDYAPFNALNSAMLKLSEMDLGNATEASIQESLLNMVTQGLSVAKDQGYFIVYGSRLNFQRSYFGDIAIAQRVEPGIEPYYDVIYDGEEFLLDIQRGRVLVASHKRKLEMINPRNIKGAYCGFVEVRRLTNGERLEYDLGAEVMTIDQIRKSWEKSKTYKPDGSSFHNDQTDQACLRTVIRRRCKPIIKMSSDRALLASIAKTDFAEAESVIDAEAETMAEEEIINVNGSLPATGSSQEDASQSANSETAEPGSSQVISGGGDEQVGESKLPFSVK